MQTRFRLTPVVAALLPLFLLPPAQADSLPAGTLSVESDTLNGQMDVELKASGQVKAVRDDQTVEADWLEYFVQRQQLRAGERVRLTQADGRIEAEQLDYLLGERSGSASNASFSFGRDGKTLRGNAGKLEFQGKDNYRLQRARANTCAPDDDSWYLKAGTIDLDYGRNVGVARNARVEFQGVPILYTPWIDFPLDGGRKSGLLFPTISTGSDGLQVSLPYYWNIAPNYDATITPRYIEQRGMMLGLEGRYLLPGAQGQLYTEQLPDDRKSERSRFLWKGEHVQQLAPALGAGVNGVYVSDDDYFDDFGDRVSSAANVNLKREAWLSYQPEWGSVTLKAQRYQTLQDDSGTVEEPYARLPQLSINARQQFAGFSSNLESELTRFSHSSKQEGTRLVAYPSLSYAIERPWGFLRPKVGIHFTRYELDNSDSSQAVRSDERTLPIVSLDSGLYFERDSTLFGRDINQTLEPRLFYVKIPKVEQSSLPNFDTSENDFNFAQLFTENRFSGHDRINAANQVTAALTSRYLDKENGLERLRIAIGQRFYLSRDDIRLDGSSSERSEAGSDLLVTVGGDLSHSLRLDSSYQYNQALSKTERYNAQLRYNPAPGKTVSVRYRYGRDELIGSGSERDTLRQVDVAGQWPIAPRWYAVVRQNYSLRDKKALEQLAGVEYNDGCWSMRVVGQRYVTDLDKTKNAVFLQLELKDFSSVGSNPLNALRLAIPGYSPINETTGN